MTGHYVIYRIKVLPPYSFHLTCVSITNNTSHSHSPVCQCSSVPRISPCRLVDCQTGSCSIRKYVNLLRGNKQPPFLSAGQHVTVFVHRRKIFFGRQLSQMYQFAWLSPSPCCHPLLCFSPPLFFITHLLPPPSSSAACWHGPLAGLQCCCVEWQTNGMWYLNLPEEFSTLQQSYTKPSLGWDQCYRVKEQTLVRATSVRLIKHQIFPSGCSEYVSMLC